MNNPLFKTPKESLTPLEEDQIFTELADAYQAGEHRKNPELADKLAKIIAMRLNETLSQGRPTPL